MRKTDIDYSRGRIEEVVRCTNGEISTRMQRKKVKTHLSVSDKVSLIRRGKATLKIEEELWGQESEYGRENVKAIFPFFDFQIGRAHV